MDQLYIYLYPLPHGPPCHPPPHPSRPSQSTELSSLCSTAAPHLALYLTHGHVYMSTLLSQVVPPSPLSCVGMSNLCLRLYSCLRNRFISAIFLNSTYIDSLWEKEMATHSCILAWRIPGTGEPGGLSSMGSHRVRHDWSNLAAAADSLWETPFKRNSDNCLKDNQRYRTRTICLLIFSD